MERVIKKVATSLFTLRLQPRYLARSCSVMKGNCTVSESGSCLQARSAICSFHKANWWSSHSIPDQRHPTGRGLNECRAKMFEYVSLVTWLLATVSSQQPEAKLLFSMIVSVANNIDDVIEKASICTGSWLVLLDTRRLCLMPASATTGNTFYWFAEAGLHHALCPKFLKNRIIHYLDDKSPTSSG